MKVRSVHEDTLNEIRNSNASDIIENRYLAYFNRPADSGDINLSASSNNYNYYQPLPTIHEWQCRKFPSPSTAYPSRPKVSDSNVKGPKINETSNRHSKSVFMAMFPVSSHNYASASGILGVLQSLQITHLKESSDNYNVVWSNLQIKSVSGKSEKLSISDELEHVDSRRVPAHLLTPLSSTNKFEGEMHADTKQHSLEYGQTDHIASSTDYQHPNKRLNFEEENKKNSKSQIPTVPDLLGSSFIRKSNSKLMSIPHLDLSALTQVTPSINATVASAADAVAPDSSASQSPFETNLPFIKPCVSTEKNEHHS